ncbi:MAG: ABC transporter substrate-binding protein [Microthrixaceae bacterium]
MKISRAVIAAFLLLVGITACSSDDNDSASGGTDDGGDTSSDSGECDASDPVTAGVIFSMSGPAAAIGEDANTGGEFAVETINEQGGILGRCLETIVKDDGGDPTKAGQVARELVDQEEVDFVIGPFLSSPTGAVLEITGPAGIPHATLSSLADAGDASKYPYVFGAEVTTDVQAEDFVNYAKNNDLDSLGIIAVNNALGIDAAEFIEEGAAENDITIIGPEFHETGATNMTTQMTKLKEGNPDAVVSLNTAAPDTAAVIKARNALEWDVPILGFSSTGFAAVTADVGEEGMNDVYAGQLYWRANREADGTGPSDPEANQWWLDFKEFTGTDPLTDQIQMAAGTYDAFMMMATAINEVGEIDPDGIKEYLETNGYDAIRSTYEFTPESHLAIGSDDLAWVVASSFNDGTHEIAVRSEG